MKLYRASELPNQWVGEDKHGALMAWPKEPRGWMKRTAYLGPPRQLEEVEPALARGTGWPGAGRAPRPRAPSGEASTERLAIRATPTEFKEWKHWAKEDGKRPSDWGRDELNAASARRRAKAKRKP